MQNNQAKPWLRPCSKCGKQTFSDLLDRDGFCDYCREVRSMKATVSRVDKKQKSKN